MFTLRLFIMGLVALVPSDDGKNFTLVLQATDGLHHDERHVPILICDPRQSECSATDHNGKPSNQWGTIVRDLNLDHGPPGMGFRMRGELINLQGGNSGTLDTFPGGKQRRLYHRFLGLCPKILSKASDLSWVPAVADFDDAAALIDDRHLLSPDRRDVAALLTIAGVDGRFLSYRFPTIRSPERAYIHSLEFKKKKSRRLFAWRQAAPDVLLLQVPLAGDTASFVLEPFGAGKRRYLKVRSRDGSKVVDVLLGNLTPLSELSEEDGGGSVGSPVEHFELYYALSASGPPEAEAKVPHIERRPRVDANRLIRPIPSVVRLVSRRKGTVGGLDRPVCGSTSMQGSPGGTALRLAASIAAGGAAAPSGPAAAPAAIAKAVREEEAVLGIGAYPATVSYRSKYAGEQRRFSRWNDAVVVSWEFSDGNKEPIERLKAPVRPILEAQSDGRQVIVLPGTELRRWLLSQQKDLATYFGPQPNGAPPSLAWMPAYLDENEGVVRYFLPDRFRVWFKSEKSVAEAESVVRMPSYCPNCKVQGTSQRDKYHTVYMSSPQKLFEVIEALQGEAQVLVAEPAEVGLGKIPAVTARERERQCSEWGTAVIRAPEAHRASAKGQGVVIAIVDTGVDEQHEHLRGHVLENTAHETWDFVQHDEVPEDTVGHGTHVAGIIAAAAPESRILPLRVDLGSGDDKSIVDAIRFVARRAKADGGHKFVLNMSWVLGVQEHCVLAALREAAAEGVLMVAAAGNDPHDLADTPEYPASFPKVMAVAATYADDVKTFDSNYGTGVDVVAPGWGIESAWIDKDGKHNKTRCADGTSMAAAYASGAAALVWSKDSTLQPGMVRAVLECRANNDITRKNSFSLRGKLGKVRVDAAEAVRWIAASRPGDNPCR